VAGGFQGSFEPSGNLEIDFCKKSNWEKIEFKKSSIFEKKFDLKLIKRICSAHVTPEIPSKNVSQLGSAVWPAIANIYI